VARIREDGYRKGPGGGRRKSWKWEFLEVETEEKGKTLISENKNVKCYLP